MQLAAFERLAQWLAGAKNLFLADEFIECARPHPIGQRRLLAARTLGLDCGPMSGFDNAKVDAEFFPDGQLKSNFLCNLGKGDPSKLPPVNPRFAFDEVCRII